MSFELAKIYEVEALREELAEARKDAARYRWLRELAHTGFSDPGWSLYVAAGGEDNASFDEAVDAAMGKKP